MSRKIILHIGRHKCGTSSIQRTMEWNREELAGLGFFYPETSKGEIAHHRIGRTLADQRFMLPADSVARENIQYVLQGARGTPLRNATPEILKRSLELLRSGRLFGRASDKLQVDFTQEKAAAPATHNLRGIATEQELELFRESLRDAEQEWAVVSSETFQNCRSPGKIRRFFHGFKVYPVCYIREQGAYLRSSYAQRVQASHYGGSLEEYYRDSFSADYSSFLDKWSRSFGKSIIVRRFERDKLYQGDVIHDFFTQVLGLKPEQYHHFRLAASENPSLSATMLAFKLRLNREGYALEPNIYHLLISLDAPGSTPYQLTPEFLSQIRERYRDSNRRVAERFFQGEELFTIPGEAQAHPLPELQEPHFQELLQAVEEASPGCIRAVSSAPSSH